MTTTSIRFALTLLASAALAGCLEVRHPLADSDASVDEGTGVMGNAGRASTDPPGGGAAGDSMMPGPDGTYGGAEAAGAGGDYWPGAAGAPGMWPPDGEQGGAGAGAAGMPWPVGGGAGGGGFAAGAGGAAGAGPYPVCCDDGDPCTSDVCYGDGTCDHHSLVTTIDDDGDMISNGCDCNDLNADVRPGQTAFFVEPESGSFDYDCDGLDTLLLTSEARTCEVYQGLDVCFGDGWLLDAGQEMPGCGSGGAYQACEFHDGMCTATVLMMLQRCR